MNYFQELLPQAEVINFGVHGYGHDQMLIFFKEEGVKYKPDVVILGFVYQDLLLSRAQLWHVTPEFANLPDTKMKTLGSPTQRIPHFEPKRTRRVG